MEIKYLESASRLLDRIFVSTGSLDRSKEISLGQRTAEVPSIRIGGLTKKPAARPSTGM